MSEINYHPVPHDHDAFLQTAAQRPAFKAAYASATEAYQLVRARLSVANSKSDGLPAPKTPVDQR